MGQETMKHEPVEGSTSIKSLAYDQAKQSFEVKFKNGPIYVHHGVVIEDFNRLKNAPSVGAHYRQFFYGKHSK